MIYRWKFTRFAFLVVAMMGIEPISLSQATHGANTLGAGSVVPFVGCKSDGQLGPRKAPKGVSRILPINKERAQRLAYYQTDDGWGVLAPRGWYCFETYGSNGVFLFVSPEPLDAKTIFATSWEGFTGPVVQMSVEYGGTSGRFSVAQTIARVFPAQRAFVQKVLAEGVESTSDFPFGPYPDDKLTYKNEEMVEYETPAHTDGLGTRSRIQKNSDSIRGVAILAGKDTDLFFLAARLPSEMNDLTSIIVQQVEREAVADTP